jgi:PAS domain-containing protein
MLADDLFLADRRVAALCQLIDADAQPPDTTEFQALADRVGDPVYTTDAEGFLVYYNQAAQRVWGWQPKSGVQQWCGAWRLLTADGAPLPHGECPMAVALREARAVRGHAAVMERPDGVRIPFMPFPTPLVGRDGRLRGGVNMLVAETGSTIGHLFARLQSLGESCRPGLPDPLYDSLMHDIETTTVALAETASVDLAALRMKLAVLRDRLADSADPDFPAERVTLRLAEAALRDAQRLLG